MFHLHGSVALSLPLTPELLEGMLATPKLFVRQNNNSGV
jgi:hypothetical protein